MGLFVAEDGHYQGWLAALLCCFAAVNEDESPIESRKAEGHTAACNQQPMPLISRQAMNTILTLNAFKGDQPKVDGTRQVLRVPDHPPLLSPFDFGDRALIRNWPTEPEHKRFLSENYGATVFAPQSLHLFDHSDHSKPTLVPLRLGPVVLRDLPSTEPDVKSSETLPRSISTDGYSPYGSIPSPDSEYLEPRDAPMPRVLQKTPPRISSMASTTSQSPPSTTVTPTRSSTASLPGLSHQTSRSSFKSRSSTERPQPKRKRSFPLVRRDMDERLDQEILELNTIVEERRAETARENGSNHHIAAVAPSMEIGARSETLDAIGSALSRPLTSQSGPRPVHNVVQPAPSLQRSLSTSSSWSTNRLSGWLSTILPTVSSRHHHHPNGEPFYKCQTPIMQQHQHTHSATSTSTSWTEGEHEIPSLTTGSSPTSKGHSRTLTDESRYTDSTRSGTGGWSRTTTDKGRKAEELFPIALDKEDVGLAF